MKSESLNRPFASYIRSAAAAVPSLPLPHWCWREEQALHQPICLQRNQKATLPARPDMAPRGDGRLFLSILFIACYCTGEFLSGILQWQIFLFSIRAFSSQAEIWNESLQKHVCRFKGMQRIFKNSHLKWLMEKAVILNIHLWFCRIWVLLFLIPNTFAEIPAIVSARFTIYESLKSWTKEDSKVSCRM